MTWFSEKMKMVVGEHVWRYLTAASLVLVLVISGLAVRWYLRARSLENNAPQQAVSERDALIARIGRLIVLPPDEQPEVATVTDPSVLKDPFFAGAKKGDKVLLYAKSRRAILFDPVAGVILNAAPLNLNSPVSSH